MDDAAQESRELGQALREMKRFIEAWAPQAVITLEDADVKPDESLVMSATPKRAGSAVGDGDTRVVLTEVSIRCSRHCGQPTSEWRDWTAQCVCSRRRAISARVGVGRLILPGSELGRSLEEASGVLAGLGEATDALLEATRGWEQALSAYETATDSMIRLQRALEQVGVGTGSDRAH